MQPKRPKSIVRFLSVFSFGTVLFSMLVVGAISYALYRQDSINDNAERAQNIAQTVAAAVDTDEFSAVLESGEKTAHWQAMQKLVNQTAADTGVTYLYILDKRYDEGVYYFVDAAIPGEDTLDLGEQDPVEAFADEMFETLQTGQPTTTNIYDSEGYGIMVSGFAPLLGQNGRVVGVVGVDLSVDHVLASANLFGLRILLTSLAFGLGFGLAAMYMVRRKVGRPVQRLTQASKQIALGNTDVALVVGTQDEIGELTASFEDILATTREQQQVLQDIANGDLTVEITPRSEYDTMSHAMQQMVQRLSEMIEEIQASTRVVYSGTVQISNGAQLLANDSIRQAQALDELSGATEAVAAKTKNNVKTASEADSLTSEIKTTAEQLLHQMQAMTKAVDEINEANGEIGKVIRVIDDIAFQTNILALNASVEAARAGESGKGFAVVAEEVRQLAGKSAKAAKETGTLIENSMQKTQLGAQIASETFDSLSDIVGKINDTSQIVNKIPQASMEQEEALQQVNAGVLEAANIAQQNTATAQESAAASEEMSQQANNLQSLVAKFQLEAEPPTPEAASKPSIPEAASKPLTQEAAFEPPTPETAFEPAEEFLPAKEREEGPIF